MKRVLGTIGWVSMKDLRNIIVPHLNEMEGNLPPGPSGLVSWASQMLRQHFWTLDMIVVGLFSGQSPESRIMDLVYICQRSCYALHDRVCTFTQLKLMSGQV